MTQTIDQLLADVSPLLPVVKDWSTTPATLLCGPEKIARDDVHADDWQQLADYALHAANHFSAMLQALREIADLPSVDLDRATDIAKQVLAAAVEVGE